MLDLSHNLGRLSVLCANALLILAVAAVSVAFDTAPRAARRVPADWHAPLAMESVVAPDARYAPDWQSVRDREPQR